MHTVSVRDWPTDKPYKEKIAKCLDQLVRAGHSIVFVPLHGVNDKQTSEETAALMSEKSYISPVDASIEETIAIIGRSRLLIGMRLHSLIFSAVTNTPFIAISYDPKIDAFASVCEQQIAGHAEKDNWDETTLLNEVDSTLENGAMHQGLLQNKMVEFQRDALETPMLFCRH